MASLLLDTPAQTKERVAKSYGIGPYPIRCPKSKVNARRYCIELLALMEVACDKAIESNNPAEKAKHIDWYRSYGKQHSTISQLFDTLPDVTGPEDKEESVLWILP